jgi:UDP-N-acetylglucosamine diphosphorylase / glucose-1-phosphate thymidylyltransferase / UDP-N-acetylgalactosamine diphosphorylase / glucosamine-1-phosphate N-acetyltransferase / galactosamine-1-phosphate N-acetyltransferase
MMTYFLQKKEIKLKAIILAAGRGKRLTEFSNEINKCMMPFGKQPLIQYSLDNAVRLDVSEIIIVVGYLAEQIINEYGNYYKDTRIKYVIQKEQKGLVHALGCCKGTIGSNDFILFLGDEFFVGSDHKSLVQRFYEENAFAVCGVIKVKDRKMISKTYSLLYDNESSRVFRLIEKPQNPLNDLMGSGNIIFKNDIFHYIEKTPINTHRKEKELPDLIQCSVDDGKKVLIHLIASEYVNINSPEDITILNKIVSDTYDKDGI